MIETEALTRIKNTLEKRLQRDFCESRNISTRDISVNVGTDKAFKDDKVFKIQVDTKDKEVLKELKSFLRQQEFIYNGTKYEIDNQMSDEFVSFVGVVAKPVEV